MRCLSLLRIYTFATRIAIPEYYKTRNSFFDSGGHQETGCEEKNWKNAYFKFHLFTRCPSLWRISILATRIAIPEYYKTRNSFLDPGGHQKTGCEDFFWKKLCFFKFHLLTRCPSLWRISILATRIAIPEYYKTRNSFWDSGDHQEIICEEFFFEKMHFLNFTY